MKIRKSVLMVLVTFSCLIASCTPQLTEEEATLLAENRIAEYARSERLALTAFGKPKISSEPGHSWVFDYASNTSPRHLVRVYVDSRDMVELSRMIDE